MTYETSWVPREARDRQIQLPHPIYGKPKKWPTVFIFNIGGSVPPVASPLQPVPMFASEGSGVIA